MDEERLIGLALLHARIHRNMEVDSEEVIDIYSKKRKHKFDFLL
nr:unnamed protein product [Callosobruchus chinensis]